MPPKPLPREVIRENQRQSEAAYLAGRELAGFVRVRVWVPEEKRQELIDFAASLRGEKRG